MAGKGQPPLSAPHIDDGRAYVVLKPFVFPPGLYGAHSALFFIEKGAPPPKGQPGHSPVLDFNTMLCDGELCDDDE